MKGPFPWIVAAWLVLAIRGLAPVAAFGGWRSLLVLEALALASCLVPAWRFRRGSSDRTLRDPATFLLLANFPLWALSYFVVGANHGVDAIDHLEFVRSAVFDHDLDVRNDDAVFGGGAAEQIDPSQINMHGVGPAILWTPMYLVANALCGTIGQSCNGVSRPYLAACTLTSMMVSAWGLVAAYRFILRFAPRGPSMIATMGLAWGTFLSWYMTVEPTMSHNLSFAGSALAFLLMTQAGGRPRGWWFLAGLAVGFTASIRFADVLIGALALPFVLAPQSARPPRDILKDALALVAGVLVGFAPQMYAWQTIFGRPLVIPHGSNFLEHGSAWVDVLFSPQSGLLTWSPLLYLAVPGLLAVRRLGWRFAVGCWTAILLVYVTNARAHWWAGAGFGARRFCTVLPLLGVGLAITTDALSQFVKRRPLFAPAGIIVAFTAWNLLLAEGHRQEAWVWDRPVSFSHMARVSADLIQRSVGSPFAAPGSLWESVSTGKPLTEYEAAMFRPVSSRFALRFGDGDFPFLRSGFSAPQSAGGDLHRSTRNGVVEVYLHRAEDYVAAFELAGAEDASLIVEFNGRAALTCPLTAQPRRCEGVVAAPLLRDGRNEIRVRVEPLTPRTRDAWLYALELVPRRNVVDVSPTPATTPADETRR